MAPRDRVPAGAEVVVELPEPLPGLAPEPVPFTVRFEDERVAVVDKPAGVVVHPGAGQRTGTLAAGLLERWPELEGVGDQGRWGIVHRLDRETSGLLVVAKDAATHAALRRLLRDRAISRHYLTLVAGAFQIATGIVDAALGRDPRRPTRIAVQAGGRPARTHYRRLAGWAEPRVALVAAELETGRTHQIRVHMRAIDHPVVGDDVYGTRLAPPVDPGRVWLHAARLVFVHPATGVDIDVAAPLPADLAASLAALGRPDEGELPTAQPSSDTWK